MRAIEIVRFLLPAEVLLLTACASNQKPFDQMTAREHLQAAARENQMADRDFEMIRPENIEPPETLPTGDQFDFVYSDWGGAVPYTYEVNDPDAYIAWARVSDPSESAEDAASKHRENALRHERRAAALEGRPSPQPLPPPQGRQLLPDQG